VAPSHAYGYLGRASCLGHAAGIRVYGNGRGGYRVTPNREARGAMLYEGSCVRPAAPGPWIHRSV